MQTNVELSSGSIPQLLGYQDAFKNIESKQLKGEGATLPDGGSYQIVTSEHMLEMQNVLRKSLGLDEVTELETNAVLYEELYGSAAPSSGQLGNDATTGAADFSAYSSNPYGTDQNGQYYGQYGQ